MSPTSAAMFSMSVQKVEVSFLVRMVNDSRPDNELDYVSIEIPYSYSSNRYLEFNPENENNINTEVNVFDAKIQRLYPGLMEHGYTLHCADKINGLKLRMDNLVTWLNYGKNGLKSLPLRLLIEPALPIPVISPPSSSSSQLQIHDILQQIEQILRDQHNLCSCSSWAQQVSQDVVTLGQDLRDRLDDIKVALLNWQQKPEEHLTDGDAEKSSQKTTEKGCCLDDETAKKNPIRICINYFSQFISKSNPFENEPNNSSHKALQLVVVPLFISVVVLIVVWFFF